MGLIRRIFGKKKDENPVEKVGEVIVNFHGLVKQNHKKFENALKRYNSTDSSPQRLNYSTQMKGAYSSMLLHYNEASKHFDETLKIFKNSPNSENKQELEKTIKSMKFILEDMEKMIKNTEKIIKKNKI